MRSAALALALALVALAAVGDAQGPCNGDLSVHGSLKNYFDGTYKLNSVQYHNYNSWTATGLPVGTKTIFRSKGAYNPGLWVVQDSTSNDAGAYYDFAQSSAQSPSDIVTTVNAGWGNGNTGSYLHGATITCTQPAPTPSPQPPTAAEPFAQQTVKPTACFEAGFSADVTTNAACAVHCGCDSALGYCAHCCKHDPAAGTCQRSKELPMKFHTATTGFERMCDPVKCPASRQGNGVCDGACNNPDCGFDKGDCCQAASGYAHHATNPLNCQETPPTADYWRFEYHLQKCRKHIRNQGTCGACYAFAVTTSLNHQQCMAGDPEHHKRLSPQYMESCFTAAQGGSAVANQNCNGGIIEYCNREFTSGSGAAGVPYDACYPYVSETLTAQSQPVTCNAAGPSCPSGYANNMVKYAPGDTMTANKNYYAIDFTAANKGIIKDILRNYGPVSFKFIITEGFLRQYNASNGFEWDPVNNVYKGLYSSNYGGTAQHGGHAVTATGYGWFLATDGVTKKYYWIFENSWGFPDTHDNGYFYWDMDDHHAFSILGAQFVLPGDARTGAWIRKQDFCHGNSCTTMNTNAGGTGRRLQEAGEGAEAFASKPSFSHKFGRRMLADVANSLNADGIVKEVKGAGGIEKTDCERPAAVEHIMQSIQTIAQVVGDQMGQTVNIKRKDMKQCLAQASGHEHLFLDFTVEIEYVFHKDVQINVTKHPRSECKTFNVTGGCAEELGEDGNQLDNYHVVGCLLDDDGVHELCFGGDKYKNEVTRITEIYNHTIVQFADNYGEESINFWDFVGAVVTGLAFVFVGLAAVKAVARRMQRKKQEEHMHVQTYENAIVANQK